MLEDVQKVTMLITQRQCHYCCAPMLAKYTHAHTTHTISQEKKYSYKEQCGFVW